MATITKKHTRTRQFGSAPYGNLTALFYQLESNAAGAVIPSDVATAAQIADVIDLGEIPANARLVDSFIRVSNAFTALATASLGFKASDGVSDATVPDDAAYFGAAIAINAAGTYRNSTSKAIVAPRKNSRLILTLAGAALAEVGLADIVLLVELGGK